MRERPILFSGEMVRAILEDRKWQTRRVVKPQPEDEDALWPNGSSHVEWHDFADDPLYYASCGWCPYGAAGDRLWVRETWQEIPDDGGTYVYRATDPDWETTDEWTWKPSLFMPRAASRITLSVACVQVQRLQDITTQEIIAEGVDLSPVAPDHKPDARRLFRMLWDSINENRPGCAWSCNPWVWAITFKRIAQPASQPICPSLSNSASEVKG